MGSGLIGFRQNTIADQKRPRLGGRDFTAVSRGWLARAFIGLAALGSITLGSLCAYAERPNIVFLMADDWSAPHAGIMGDPVVKTPTFDRVAKEGVLFRNAYVSAPSCTPSRFAIVSGQYHWRLGEGVDLWGSLARDVPVYPELLEAAGYHIGFSRKGAAPSRHTYRRRNALGDRYKDFDEYLETRNPRQPLCYWYGSGDAHRPYEWQSGLKSGMKLEDVEVPAYLPDNETVRTDLLDYYWEVERYDRDSAAIIARLEQEGELENTIIVMAGDNGLPFPRAKATLYDAGTHVPLAIRWGSEIVGDRVVDDFVNLTDLAPTFLEAVGLSRPKVMTGRSLLGILKSSREGLVESERDHVLTGMEKHVYSYPSRAMRTAEYLYIRNFNPQDWPNGQWSWPTRDGDFSFNIDPAPSKWFLVDHKDDPAVEPLYRMAFGRPPPEELFDVRADPDQIHNLAADPALSETLAKLRARLGRELLATEDPRFEKFGYEDRTIAGWQVHVRSSLDKTPRAEAVLRLLGEKLREIADWMQPPDLESLRQVPFWIGDEKVRGPRGEYHPSAEWLRDNGFRASKAKSIEFDDADFFLDKMGEQPMMVLHELAHAFHHQVLGHDDPSIVAAHAQAVASGRYDRVERGNGEFDRHYALTNPKEYFAELTETYFGRNDFYPYTREQLQEFDPRGFKLVERIWLGKY